VEQQEHSLKNAYEKDGWQIKTFTDVQFDSTGNASVGFGVLAYPDDVVYVNEKPYDVTFVAKNRVRPNQSTSPVTEVVSMGRRNTFLKFTRRSLKT
jgi:hypothetical protein